MKLEHCFVVSRPADRAFALPCDVGRSTRSMPGATVEAVDANSVTGLLAVRLGPMLLQTSGVAESIEVNCDEQYAVVQASAQGGRRAGSAQLTVKLAVPQGADGGTSEVAVTAEVELTGRPTRLGRRAVDDVATRLVEQFAPNLAAQLNEDLGAPATGSRGEASSGVLSDPPAMQLVPASDTDKRRIFAVAAALVAVILVCMMWHRRG